MITRPAIIEGRHFVGEHLLDVHDKFTGGTIARVPHCSDDDVGLACRAAHDFRAHAEATPAGERASTLRRAADLLGQRRDEVAELIVAEAGKPITAARGEVSRCIDTLILSATSALEAPGDLVPMDATAAGRDRLGFTLRVPIGVVAAITPFNFPLNLVAHKLGPAVAAGCPVVLKPAELSPLSALALVDLLVEAGLDPNWIQVVTGLGTTTGAALVGHELPEMVSFTGSDTVGWAIRSAAPHKRVALELGSVAPVIITANTDLMVAARKVADGAFGYAGQSCISTQRVLVAASHFDTFVDHLTVATDALGVGDPRSESTVVGPMISEAALAKASALVADAVDRGARVIVGDKADGTVLLPTILVDVSADALILTTEVFAPVVVVESYDDFHEVVAELNRTDLAIHVGIFTDRLDDALTALRRLHFGGVMVNDVPTFRVEQQPYGGVRQAGDAREGPSAARQEMTTQRFVSIARAT